MNRNEQILIWLLRLCGVVMLTALAAVVMPYEWMNVIHRQTGLGELPHVPIVGYLTRSISALYAFHGALLVFLASDVRRYLPIVRFLALAEDFTPIDGVPGRAVRSGVRGGDSVAHRTKALAIDWATG